MEKEISKIKDYRREFKKYYNLELSEEYDIHHIDLNHENNDMNNLMILPKILHIKYHSLLNDLRISKPIKTITLDLKIHGNQINLNSYNLQIIKDLISVLDECAKWYDYKLYLDGKLNNIHGIKLD